MHLDITDCDIKIGATMRGNLSLDLDDVTSPKIYDIRGERVVLDRDVARLFGTTTTVFNQQVKRNKDRHAFEHVSCFHVTECRT